MKREVIKKEKREILSLLKVLGACFRALSAADGKADLKKWWRNPGPRGPKLAWREWALVMARIDVPEASTHGHTGTNSDACPACIRRKAKLAKIDPDRIIKGWQRRLMERRPV